MKKRLISMGMAAAMLASTMPVIATAAENDKYQLSDLNLAKTSEVSTWNILQSMDSSDFDVLAQVVDGLLEVDSYGRLVPGLAESWSTEDGGKTWTFNLRKGVKWVDWQGNEKAECTAWDFATGLEWVMNVHKNDGANTSMAWEMIEGAGDYFGYTEELSYEDGIALTAGEGSKFLEMVGIEVVDDYTLVYHCNGEKPYFDSLCLSSTLFPLHEGAVEAAGGVEAYKYEADNTKIWYNGPYTVTEFEEGNYKVFTKNASYWDTDAHLFDTVTYKCVNDTAQAYIMFQTGEVDYVDLTADAMNEISGDANHEFNDNYVPTNLKKYSYQWHWNYDKHLPDGSTDINWNKAIANKAFRQSIYYGFDYTEALKSSNRFDPLALENNFYTMKGLVYTSEGTEYTELVRDELGLGNYDGQNMIRHNAEKAAELKALAMMELEAEGVTFPVHMSYYVGASNQSAINNANILKQCIEESLGSDYIVLDVCTFEGSQNSVVRDPKLQSLMSNGWGADYADPMNFLSQEIKGYGNAWYADRYSNIEDVPVESWSEDLHAAYDEFTEMVWTADAINDDLDARYKAFAKAEAFLIENALVMPYNYGQSFCLTKVNIHSQMNSMVGNVNAKMKNWETSTEPYTQNQWEEITEAKGVDYTKPSQPVKDVYTLLVNGVETDEVTVNVGESVRINVLKNGEAIFFPGMAGGEGDDVHDMFDVSDENGVAIFTAKAVGKTMIYVADDSLEQATFALPLTLTVNEAPALTGDVTGDGIVDIADVTKLYDYVMGYIDEL